MKKRKNRFTDTMKLTATVKLAALTLAAAFVLSGCGGAATTVTTAAGTTASTAVTSAAATTSAEPATATSAAATEAATTAAVETTAAETTAVETAEAANTAPDGGLAGTRLNLFTWEGMFPQEALDKFESDTGVLINYNNFDYDETMLSKLQAANGGDYDLIIADDYIIKIVIGEGLAQKLDISKIPNFGNIDPIYQGQFYDPADDYTVPYGAGVQTIVYNPANISIDIKGYSDLWDPSLKDSVGVIANYRVINGMALKVLGKSYNTNDLDEIRAAGDKLVELAPNIRIIKDDQLEADLLSGEIDAAVMYTSQVYMSVMENPDLKIVFPKEGIGFGIMAGFIPVNAPNAAAAHKFLDFILEERTAADCFEWLGYYSTNKAANKYFAPELQSLLILPDGFNSNMEMIELVDDASDAEHDLMWTKFKAAAGQ